MKWQILLTPTALKLLSDISDRRIREKIGTVIDRLIEDPEKQGKALLGELAGFRSVRAVGQRYRIMYQNFTPSQIIDTMKRLVYYANYKSKTTCSQKRAE